MYNKPLQRAIEQSDVIGARAALITHIDNDATSESHIAMKIADEVNETFQLHGKNFYEKDDGRLDCSSSTAFTSTLWNQVKAALSINFSREKILFATKIAQELRKCGETSFQAQKQAKPASHNQPHSRSKVESSNDFVEVTSSSQDYARSAPSSSSRTTASRTARPHKRRITVVQKSSLQSTAIVRAIIVGAVVGGVAGAVVGATVAGVVIGGAVGGSVTYYRKK